MATAAQIEMIRSLFMWTTQCCYAQLTATAYEDVVRGRLLDEAISAGWTIAINKGTPIRSLSLANGLLTEAPSTLAAVAGHNPDIRIEMPSTLVVELKVRGTYGSAITRPVQHVDDDFGWVASSQADVFILAVDRSKYDLMRTGNAALTWPTELPDSNLLSHVAADYTTSRQGIAARCRAQLVSSPFGERVAVAFYLP